MLVEEHEVNGAYTRPSQPVSSASVGVLDAPPVTDTPSEQDTVQPPISPPEPPGYPPGPPASPPMRPRKRLGGRQRSCSSRSSWPSSSGRVCFPGGSMRTPAVVPAPPRRQEQPRRLAPPAPRRCKPSKRQPLPRSSLPSSNSR